MPKFGAQIDAQKIPIKGLVAENAANLSAPASPVEGQLWYDTSNDYLCVYAAGDWRIIVISDNTNGLSLEELVDVSYPGTVGDGHALMHDGAGWINRLLTISDIGSLQTTLDAKALKATTVSAGTGLTGGGDLSANRTLSVSFGSTSTTVMAGNTRLDQIPAPTASVSLNSQKITNLADLTSAQDAATKAYVDATAAGLDVKASVRVASTANVAIPPGGTTLTIDGVALANNDRVLLKNQTTGSQNGIYTVGGIGSSVTLTRATDADSSAEVNGGMFVFVEEGTAHQDSGWVLATNNPITLGTTALSFTQFPSAASLTAGAGLTQTGNTFDVVGTANRITVAADSIDIASTYVGQTSITTVGTITSGTWNATDAAVAAGGTGASDAATARTNLSASGRFTVTYATALVAGVYSANITHSLNTSYPQVSFNEVATGEQHILDYKVIDANNIQIKADIAYSASALRLSVQG